MKELKMGEPDRQSVSIEFKLSKNYNSVGGSVSFASDRKDGEGEEELFQRVYNNVDEKVQRLINKAEKVLG
jgi:hypothetical protein